MIYNTDKYQVMPPLTDEEYNELKSNIADNGVRVNVEVDEDGNVLDGHHRVRVCQELGITDIPTHVNEGLTEHEKLLLAFTLNTARRQLTRDQKAEAIKQLIRRDPTLSDRKIADALGVSHPTVGKYRRQMEAEGQVVKVTTRTGSDGKTYDTDMSNRNSFTCCICGKEHPACYEQGRDGKWYNVWGYDPWPMSVKGDCCQKCWNSINDVVERMPKEARNRHYSGPYWHEILDVWEAMHRDGWQFSLCDSVEGTQKYHEFDCEFERRMEAIGIHDGAWRKR